MLACDQVANEQCDNDLGIAHEGRACSRSGACQRWQRQRRTRRQQTRPSGSPRRQEEKRKLGALTKQLDGDEGDKDDKAEAEVLGCSVRQLPGSRGSMSVVRGDMQASEELKKRACLDVAIA